jgi:hypothetical protein
MMQGQARMVQRPGDVFARAFRMGSSQRTKSGGSDSEDGPGLAVLGPDIMAGKVAGLGDQDKTRREGLTNTRSSGR